MYYNKTQEKGFVKRIEQTLCLAFYDFKGKYAGSTAGALWAALYPAVTVLVYWFVYTVAFGGGDIKGVPYYLWLSVGIAPWIFLSEGLSGVCSVYRDYSYMLKKVSVNKQILPWVRGISALISHLFFTVIVLVLCGFFGKGICFNWLYLLPVMAVTFVFVLSLGRILAIACAYFKDVKDILTVCVNIGFWITPIFWNIDAVGEKLKFIIRLNPAAVISEAYREALLYNDKINISGMAYVLAISAVLYIIGLILSKKKLPDIADRL